MARAALNLSCAALAACLAASPLCARDLKDLYLGEALYYAKQGQYLEALERLDAEMGQYRDLDEPQLDTLHYHIGEAQF